MDLIVEELEIHKKEQNLKGVNFSLRNFRAVEAFTKWKRNLITEEDREKFFKDFERNKRFQKQLRRAMRNFIA